MLYTGISKKTFFMGIFDIYLLEIEDIVGYQPTILTF
jgi:hypothetical protein